MRILGIYGKEDLAKVYVASMRDGKDYLVEFVESLQPPLPREKKWVLIVSSLFGCPVQCKMCDAGSRFLGRLETDEILAQIEYMVRRYFPDGKIPIPKFKIQFARMGEPSLNPNVLNALERLPEIYDAPGLIPSLSTVAPKGTHAFFEKLIEIKNKHYPNGRFQLQFSIHTTEEEKRDELIPIKKWSFEEIAEFGKRFYRHGDRKVTLNFASARNYPLVPEVIKSYFDPSFFLIKLTPLNPTSRVKESRLESLIDPYNLSSAGKVVESFKSLGYDVILSIGELEENKIGSNCGQFVTLIRDSKPMLRDDYETKRYEIVS